MQYLHRSVQDFLATENPTTTWLGQEIRAQKQAYPNLILSQLVIPELGCVCRVSTLQMMLSRSLRIVDEPDLEHLGTEIMRFKEHNHAMHNGHICGYGRSHRLFNHR